MVCSSFCFYGFLNVNDSLDGSGLLFTSDSFSRSGVLKDNDMRAVCQLVLIPACPRAVERKEYRSVENNITERKATAPMRISTSALYVRLRSVFNCMCEIHRVIWIDTLVYHRNQPVTRLLLNHRFHA